VFAPFGRVGCIASPQVTPLAVLINESCCRIYCGRSADGGRPTQFTRGELRTADWTQMLSPMRDIETIDSDLRLVAALRRAARELAGPPLPSIDVADALLDERRGLTEWATTSGIFTISDLSKRGSVYAPLDESASVAGRPPQWPRCARIGR
jgi:hypothetical protein